MYRPPPNEVLVEVLEEYENSERTEIGFKIEFEWKILCAGVLRS